MHPRLIKKKSYGKHAPQARFSMKQNAPQARLMKQNVPQVDFVTKSSWVLCPVNAVFFFFTNHSSKSSFFDELTINRLTFGRPILCLFYPLVMLYMCTTYGPGMCMNGACMRGAARVL